MHEVTKDLIAEVRARPEDFRLLRRVPDLQAGHSFGGDQPPANQAGDVVFLDCETTGLDRIQSRIIQLGMLRIRCNRATGELIEVVDSASMYEDPGSPLSEEIRKLTGIRDSDLKGKSLDVGVVRRLMKGAPLVLAHNAGFDRKFFDRRFRRFRQLAALPWGCTSRDPDWKASGYDSRALNPLLIQAGFFSHPRHEALADTRAAAWLMHRHPERMLEVLRTAAEDSVVIWAVQSPFSVKDTLKERGYRWDPGERCWYRKVSAANEAEEFRFLRSTYRGGSRAKAERVTASNRFKA